MSPQNKPSKSKNYFSLVVKLVVSCASLLLLWNIVDSQAIWRAFRESQVWWLIPAFLFFNLSQILSTLRLGTLLREVDVKISFLPNLGLYYLGMLYNLILPGGIGGDAYKAYLISKTYDQKIKTIGWTLLVDRGLGLGAIILLLCFLGSLIFADYRYWLLGLGVLGSVLYRFLFPIVFQRFQRITHQGLFLSLLIQLLQLLSVVFILKALLIDELMFQYLFVFLITSVLTIIPIFWGGLGARELIFSLLHNDFGFSEEKAILVGLLFFLITALSSAFGVFGEKLFHNKR